jgi:putative FmdB family regulatory protein
MPLYEYACNACDVRFERIQKFSDPLVTVCPSCGGVVRKLISSPAIQFKGAGWYVNDYAKAGSKSESSSSDAQSSDAQSSGSKSADAKGDAASASKADATSGSKDAGTSESAAKSSEPSGGTTATKPTDK